MARRCVKEINGNRGLVMEDNKNVYTKPPIGVKPRWLHDSERLKDILDAIERYTNADLPIPKDWVIELRDLFSKYFK